MKLSELTPQVVKEMSLAELQGLSTSVREFLVEENSVTGGHIGANLGAVELSIALHKVFNSPSDAFYFDTGHIGYTHKIITGRANLFSSLNTFGGMNRFITPEESEHDLVEVSHAGTAPSLALGTAISKSLRSDASFTVAVIGDGSLAEGVALEALNHASVEAVNLLIVVNDNGFAISPGFGAIHADLNAAYNNNKPSKFFQSLGYETSVPLDGHDLGGLISKFEDYRAKGGVQVVHLRTEKGKGFAPAESHPIKMHFSMPFDVRTGHALNPPSGRQIQTYCTDALLEEMADNESIIAITPSTKYATDLDRVADAFPGRVLDPGMSEQHALSMAAGMALDGARPVVMFQSTFMQRAFDQLVHDIAFGGADVLIVASRTGFAGYDNATHHGLIDFGYLKAIPNLRVLFPRNCESLYETMKRELISPKGPTLILFPYGFEKDYCSEESSTGLDKNCDVGIISLGNTLARANEISHQLHGDGITCSTYCIEEIKPLSKSKVVELATRHKYLFSIEEYMLDGGLNESISSALQSCSRAPFYAPFGLECKFFPGGNAEELADYSGLNSTEIYKEILKCMKES